MSDTDKNILLEAWKTSIDVQKHFNEIGWRIRGLFLSVVTFVLGATFVFSRTPLLVNPPAQEPAEVAIAVPIVGMILWIAFWFVDASWYQRFLVGAVLEAERLEEKLHSQGLDVSLSSSISENSPVERLGIRIHSRGKLHIFYLLSGSPLVLATIILFLGR